MAYVEFKLTNGNLVHSGTSHFFGFNAGVLAADVAKLNGLIEQTDACIKELQGLASSGGSQGVSSYLDYAYTADFEETLQSRVKKAQAVKDNLQTVRDNLQIIVNVRNTTTLPRTAGF